VLMHKLCNGKVPPIYPELFDELDNEAIKAITSSKEKVESLLEQYKFRDALFEVIDLARTGNQYMQKKEPWILAKQVDEQGKIQADAQRLIDNCMHICLQMTANLAILVNPFLPFTAKKICHLLKVVDKILDWENAGKL
jgi:methionyl-tRNA synthetase